MKHCMDPTRRADEPGFGTDPGHLVGHPRPRGFYVDLVETIELAGDFLAQVDQDARMGPEDHELHQQLLRFIDRHVAGETPRG